MPVVRHKTSVTAGTIFHRSRLPLTDWFAVEWFVMSQKNGVSTLGLQRVLGMGSYRTAWTWMYKLRPAMVRPDGDGPDGVVEVDETNVGGRKRGKGTEPKGFGRVRLAHRHHPHRPTVPMSPYQACTGSRRC